MATDKAEFDPLCLCLAAGKTARGRLHPPPYMEQYSSLVKRAVLKTVRRFTTCGGSNPPCSATTLKRGIHAGIAQTVERQIANLCHIGDTASVEAEFSHRSDKQMLAAVRIHLSAPICPCSSVGRAYPGCGLVAAGSSPVKGKIDRLQ